MRTTPRGRTAALGAAWALIAVAPPALAHVGEAADHVDFFDWTLSPDIVLGVAIAAWLYARGVARMRDKTEGGRFGRHLAFYSGLAAVFVALLSPLDLISEHLFSVHQVQHLLLRGIAPMLLMLAVPSGPLVAGMPEALRRRVLAPVMGSSGVRATFAFLARPLVCTLLYVATLYLWEVPSIHDAALLDEALHYTMHVTMLASGLLFFWTVFDPRPAPWGAPFHHRLMMTIGAIFANLPIGAITTLKTRVDYVAYDQLGRWFGVTSLSDESMGGLVLWVLASMMGVVAVLLLIRGWGRSEDRQDSRRRRGFRVPGPSGEGPDGAARARRRLGLGLAMVPAAVLVALFGMAIWLTHPIGGTPGGTRMSVAHHAPEATPAHEHAPARPQG